MTEREHTIAHIVHPAARLHEVLNGNRTRVKSLCGTMVSNAGDRDDPICRKCFNLYDRLDLVGGEAGTRSASAGNR